MFMAEKSGIDFRAAMDEQKIVIVDLPEGKVTTDIANFLGSLILSAVYNAGMSREDTPEEKRQPFFVYVDEAYRYTTKSIPEVLQSLRKFKVFMTLASQYLTQYRRDIQDAIVQTCETIVSFRVGEDTARVLEKFYPKQYGYQTLMNLPRHLFFVSTPFCGNREYQVLETLDYKTGSNNPDEVISHSLKTYGQKVNVDELMGQIKNRSIQQEFLNCPITPAEWVILLTIRLNGGSMDEKTLQNHLLYDPNHAKPYVLTETGLANALKNLSVDNAKRDAWLTFKDETVHQWRETAYVYGKKELKTQEIHTRFWRLDLTDKRAKQLLDTTFRGEKSGGIKHIGAIMAQRKVYWQNGWIVKIDDGETDKSLADLYVTPTLPASKVEGAKGFIDQSQWDYEHSFAVEVESYPSRHWDRLESNYRRNKKMGFPTVFIVPSQVDEEKLKEKLWTWNATVVTNATRFEANHPEMATIEVVDMLNNQPNNPIPQKDSQPLELETIEQTVELSNQNATPVSKQAKHSSLEKSEIVNQQSIVEGTSKEPSILKFVGEGWRFRIKTIGGKQYLCARNYKEEHSLGIFDQETKHIIEKHNIKVNGINEN
jgi:hypothetical protein